MDHFQFTGQFNLHDINIRVYITVYYFGSYLSLESLPTLASCWQWLKWIDVTSQGLFEVTVFKVEFCLGHCWWFSVCPLHSSETTSYIYWCMCPTNLSHLTIRILTSYRISLLVRTPVYNASTVNRTVFGRCAVLTSTGTPVDETEVFREIFHSLHESSRPKLDKHYPLSFKLIIHQSSCYSTF